MSGLFLPLPEETRRVLDRLSGLVDEVFPLPGRFRAGLKRDVAELSRLLTSGREDRGVSYLGKPALLSAYLRYFLPWNIYRLCRLFTTLPLVLKSHDAVNDFGAGPLTLAAALWISRPELRSVPLEFRCVDRTAAVLEAGKKFFAALSAETTGGSGNCPWETRLIRGELWTKGARNFGSRQPGGLSVEIRGKPAALSAAVNVYNEMFWDFSPVDTEGLRSFAGNQARLLSSLTASSGSVLVVEPGIPRSGEFISLLRSSLIKEGRPPLSPCVHPGPCPLPGGRARAENDSSARNSPYRKAGGKAKWCHFAFDTEDAPKELHKLSAAAALPKERAVLSFILAGPVSPGAKTGPEPAKVVSGRPVKIRIVSDSFPVNDTWGRYGCSERGLVLVTGKRENLDASPSGAQEELPVIDGLKDAKSGALMVNHK